MRDWAENQMMIAFIRHGETQANAQRRYLGKTDEPLSEQGIHRLLSYREQNLYPAADYLFTSPMRRCVETADILYPMLKPVVIPEWEEMDFGRFEYKNYEELKDDSYYQRWIASGGTMDFPDGEGREAFIRRCENGFQRMCRALQKAQAGKEIRNGKEPVRVSAIVHGGTIMALLSSHGTGRCRKGYFDYQTENGRGYLTFAKYKKDLCKYETQRTAYGSKNAAQQNKKEMKSELTIWIEDIKEI